MTEREMAGTLSPDESRMVSKVDDSDRIDTLAQRRQIYIEIGQPRSSGYGYLLRENDEFRVGLYSWKLDQCEERSFDEFKPALDYLLAHAVFA